MKMLHLTLTLFENVYTYVFHPPSPLTLTEGPVPFCLFEFALKGL